MRLFTSFPSRHRRIGGFAAVLLAGAIVLFYWGTPPAGPVPFMASVAPQMRQLNLVALGDWGREGAHFSRVSRALSEYAHSAVPMLDAVILTGDNFYYRLNGIHDSAWERLFEQGFDRTQLAAPFYAVLGNHDYHEQNVGIELAYSRTHPSSRFKLPRRYYRMEFPERDPLVSAFFLDSNYADLDSSQWAAEIAWLRRELSAPKRAPWRMVVAHHPLFSDGHHGDDRFLIKEWGRLLADHAVDFYVSGHDHNLQHLEVPGQTPSFIISGGGGAKLHSLRWGRGRGFSTEDNGFVHFQFGENTADVRIISGTGELVHAFTKRPRTPAVGAGG